MTEKQPLILVTNDDGVQSPGLGAAVQAVQGLGELLVAAPCQQWSGAGRSFPTTIRGTIHPRQLPVNGRLLDVYCVEGAPAQAVLHAVLELAPRRPDLLVVGVNYGENLGADVTISGTVGAALQGATMGIPALAVSQQTPKETHSNPSDGVDFSASVHFTRLLARRVLRTELPFDVSVLKIDVPADATPETPWRLTRLSRRTYFHGVPPRRADLTVPTWIDYEPRWDVQALEPDSDIYAFAVDRVVSVTPLSFDLASRAELTAVEALLNPLVES